MRDLAGIAAGQSVPYWWLLPLYPGTYVDTWSIRAETFPDPVLANNFTSATFSVYASQAIRMVRTNRRKLSGALGLLPAPDVATLRSFPGLQPRSQLSIPAPKPTRTVNRRLEKTDHVEIALLAVTTHAKPASTSQGCRWLSSRGATFATRPAFEGRCAQALWLRASGTKDWTYNLTNPMPPGRYVLYVRVVNKAGTSDGAFSAARHNRIAFTVP
jgi:hypothetical protein